MDVEDGTATPRSPVSVQLRFRGHTLVQDKPATSGGRDEGPMASELLLGALLACQHSTFVKVAAKRRVESAIRQLRGELHFDAAGDIARITVAFTLATRAEDKDVETCLRLTDKTCTVSRVLKVPVSASFSRA
jgi:uncharacterized OsmC-like protein